MKRDQKKTDGHGGFNNQVRETNYILLQEGGNF